MILVSLFAGIGPAAAAAPGQRRVMIGYVPVFKGMDPILAGADLSLYTHVDLAFANPAADGGIVRDGTFACMPGPDGAMLTTDALRQAVAQIHAAGAKALLSLGGGTLPACSADWTALLQPAGRAAAVANLVALADDLGLDGIDVDLEGEVLTAIDQAGEYTPFVAALSQALKKRGKLLTCATASYDGGMVPISSLQYFDLVDVMSYDAIGPSWGEPGSEHATLDQAKRDLALWRARGVPADRLVLGVPFYGYGFGGYDAHQAYRDIVTRFGTAAADGDVIGTRCAGCTYITYNGLTTLKAKAALARDKAAGLMVWEISQDTDDHSLARALAAALAE